jgi:geranylgeranyl pyrophosphate synthase
LEFDETAWEKSIGKPMRRILKSGGKRLRPILTIMIHDIFDGKNEDIYKLSAIPEIVHNATLMIDDIEDNSLLRRGEECAHLKYGTGITVNCGNFFYFYPLTLIPKLKCSQEQKNEFYLVFIDKLMKLHIGQAMDIQWANDGANFEVTKEQYLQMCAYKTGGLLSIAMQFGAIAAGCDKKILDKLDEIAIKMGIAYQIKDDILNITENSEWGKEFGEDITEAKLTLLVINAFKKAEVDDRDRMREILSSNTNNKSEIIEVIDIMNNCGAIKEAEIIAFNLIVDCKNDLIEYFPKNKYVTILDEMLDYLIDRKK